MSIELQRIGKYELHKRMARGNSSEVWQALDPQSQNYVTIKLIYTNQPVDSELMTQVVHEAERVASLYHPNIVQIQDLYVFPSVHPDSPAASSVICIVMEYVEGQTLADFIRSTPSTGKLPPGADIVHLFTSISLAIDYIHQHGIIHGNIKPANILLNTNVTSQGRIGEPMLTDFGFTKLLRNNGGNSDPFYLSPEQIKGQQVNTRSDIYSLGVILYELCTGVLPFRGNRPVSIMIQHVNAPPTPPALMNPTISPALANVILRSLAKDPGARFPGASSMAVALSQSLNMPVPEVLSQSAYLPHTLPEPFSNATQQHMQSQSFASSPRVPTSNNDWSPVSSIPAASISSNAFPGNLDREQLPSTPLQVATMHSLPSSASLKRRRTGLFGPWYFIVVIALVLAILGTLGALLLLPHSNATVATNRVIGHVFFVNSGQLNENSAQGINDELQIDLSSIPDPSAGKSYYAWILSDKNQSESAPILLGRLAVNHGTAHYLYAGDQRHTNLLAVVSRFLITEDSTNTPSSNPLVDTSTWRYYGEIPQSPSPLDTLHFSMLDHMRHLLVESPELRIRGLHGGLALWFVRNIATISGLANGARDDWHRNDAKSIHDQAIRILDYLDGVSLVHTDVPPGTSLLADPRNAQVALLGPAPNNPDPPGYGYNNETPPGYVYLIGIHMDGAIQSPQTTPDQRKLAIQINMGLDNVKRLLESVLRDAKQLSGMTSIQLLQPSSLSILDDLATQAQYAYTGQLNPSTGQSEGGAIWIYGNLQRLTSFDIKPYSSPAP
jgi:eukaryotic-like serine/threonine-protein kinase